MRLPSPYRLESDVLDTLLARLDGLDWASASADGVRWIEQARAAKPSGFAMETLLREYPLSTAEGLALMRLAEALLRVPDAETAMALTADQLSRADFRRLAVVAGHAVQPGHRLVQKMLGEDGQKAGFFARMGAKAVVAATVRAVQLMGKQFVMGETLDEALSDARKQRKAQRPALLLRHAGRRRAHRGRRAGLHAQVPRPSPPWRPRATRRCRWRMPTASPSSSRPSMRATTCCNANT
jgi:RHH-type proline utilization regulon transcriptional repressor/proline dehydrogenase/delta 1-pyrroline-5-carboxylate dehydrogenase